MDFVKAVPVVISGVFALAMTHRAMVKSPLRQAMVNVILIGLPPGAGGDERPPDGADRGLLDVLQQPDDPLTTPLEHPENRGFFLLQRAASPCPLQSPPSPLTAPFFYGLGRPLVARHHVHCVALDFP